MRYAISQQAEKDHEIRVREIARSLSKTPTQPKRKERCVNCEQMRVNVRNYGDGSFMCNKCTKALGFDENWD